MVEFPFFPTRPELVLASLDCQMMTTEDFGAYWLLLFHSWQQVPQATLPNDYDALRHITRLSRKKFATFWGKYSRKFPQYGGRLANPRLLSELQALQDRRRSRSNAGKKGSDVRWHTDGDAMAMPSDSHGDASDLPLANDGILNPDSNIKKTKSRKPATPPRDGAILLARKLARILREKTGAENTEKTVDGWAKFFDDTERLDGYSFDRQDAAMDALAEHWGQEFWPQIESGRAWRKKFADQLVPAINKVVAKERAAARKKEEAEAKRRRLRGE